MSSFRVRRAGSDAIARGVLLGALTLAPPALYAAGDPPAIVTGLCAGCHGMEGGSTDHLVPRVAGLQPRYLVKQMRDFASGRRSSDVMTALIAAVPEGDFRAIADYYGARPPIRGQVRDAGLAARGRLLFDDGNTETGVPACSGCHEPNGAGNALYPRVAGQHAEYAIRQLEAFKSGARDSNRLMTAVGQRLSVDEIRSVAEYMAGLEAGEAQ
jgi:cytochrome c553